MSLVVVQVIVSIFALFALSRAYLRFRERKLSSFAFIFWIGVWLAGMVAILFPDLTSFAARILGIGRGVDAVIYGSIAVLFYLIFRVYIRVEDTQKEITALVRKIALQNETRKRKSVPPKKRR